MSRWTRTTASLGELRTSPTEGPSQVDRSYFYAHAHEWKQGWACAEPFTHCAHHRQPTGDARLHTHGPSRGRLEDVEDGEGSANNQ
jgi:hypothetical protein